MSFDHTGMANTSVVNFYSDLVGLRRRNVDIFDGEFFPSFPRNGGLLFIRRRALEGEALEIRNSLCR